MPYGKKNSQLTSYDQVGVEEGAIGIRDNLVNIQVNLHQTTVAKRHRPRTVEEPQNSHFFEDSFCIS